MLSQLNASEMPSLSDAMIKPGGDMLEELGDDPPAMSDIDAPAFSFDGVADLPGSLGGWSRPEHRAFGHFRIDETGLDIGEIKRDLQLAGLDVEPFEIDALETFSGAISRGEAVAPDRGDGRNGDEMAVPLLFEVSPAEVDGFEKCVDIDVHRGLVDGPVQRFLWFAPACTIDQDVEAA